MLKAILALLATVLLATAARADVYTVAPDTQTYTFRAENTGGPASDLTRMCFVLVQPVPGEPCDGATVGPPVRTICVLPVAVVPYTTRDGVEHPEVFVASVTLTQEERQYCVRARASAMRFGTEMHSALSEDAIDPWWLAAPKIIIGWLVRTFA